MCRPESAGRVPVNLALRISSCEIFDKVAQRQPVLCLERFFPTGLIEEKPTNAVVDAVVVRLSDSPISLHHKRDKPFLSNGRPQKSIYVGVHRGCTVPSSNIRTDLGDYYNS
jgi:hypothetical protein